MKTIFLVPTERPVRRDPICRSFKRQPVGHLYYQRKFSLWLLHYVFFLKNRSSNDEKHISQKAVAFKRENL